MLRTAGFIMHIFATCFQAITVQSNCYANFALIKEQCEAWEVSFFPRAFPGRGYSYLFSMPNEEEEPSIPTDQETRFSNLEAKLDALSSSLTPGRALDQLCHRIQTSKKIFCQRKTLTRSTQQ